MLLATSHDLVHRLSEGHPRYDIVVAFLEFVSNDDIVVVRALVVNGG